MKITVGNYLLKRLKELNIDHIIGVPGDFNLQFLEQIREFDGIEFVGASNELNAAYAADGYSRERGISALSVTFGVGDLGALPGVAASCAEHIPVVVISGAPPLYASEYSYKVHHSLADGDYSKVTRCWREYTELSVLITQKNAAEEIDRALTAAVGSRKPVNLQVPSNISYLEIETDMEPLKPCVHISDSERLESCVRACAQLYRKSERPCVLVDMDMERLGIEDEILGFAEENGIPYVSMTTGKAVLSENHSLYRGIYKGDESDGGVQELTEKSDFLLTVSPRFIEWNSGTYTSDLPDTNTVRVARDHTIAGGEVYEGVSPFEMIKKLREEVKTHGKGNDKNKILNPVKADIPENPAEAEGEENTSEKKLTQKRLWMMVKDFLREGDVIYAETGTPLQGLGSVRMPFDVTFNASHIWGAIGYMLPLVFGGLLASPEKRHLLFIGDGSFQVTAQELSRIQYNGLKPIIFLIENEGYTIERYIMGMDASYNRIPLWDYSGLPAVFSTDPKMYVKDVRTEGEFKEALDDAEKSEGGALIVLHLEGEDAPAALKKFGPTVAEFNFGERGPENETPDE